MSDDFLKKRLDGEKQMVQRKADDLSAVKKVEIMEGTRAMEVTGPILDVPALEKWLVPRLGKGLAPFGTEMIEDLAMNV